MSASSQYLDTLTRLTQATGEAQARAAEDKAQLWGNTIATLGQTIPKQVQQVLQQAAERKQTAQIRQVLADNGGDLEKAIPLIMQRDPKLGMALQKEYGDALEVGSKLRKSQQEFEQAQWKFQRDKVDWAHENIAKAQTAQQYAAGILGAKQAGEDVSGYPTDFEEAKSTGFLDRMGQSLLSLKDQLELKKPKHFRLSEGQTEFSETGEPIATVPKTAPPKTDYTIGNQRFSGETNQPIATGQQPELTPYQKAELELQRQREKRIADAAVAGNAPPVEIKPGTPEYRIAQDLASGKMTFAQFRTLAAYNRNAALKFGIYDTARQLNPEFDPAQYELGFKMASNPAIRQRIVAINALSPVIDQVVALSDQAGNTDIPAFNKLLQSAKFHVGNKTVTDFRQMQVLLGDEVGMALGVGTGSDLKTRLGLDLVNPNLGPSQFRSTMEQLRSVLDARRDALYKQMGVYGAGVQGVSGDTAPATPSAPAAPKPATPTPGAGVSGRVGPYTYVVK